VSVRALAPRLSAVVVATFGIFLAAAAAPPAANASGSCTTVSNGSPEFLAELCVDSYSIDAIPGMVGNTVTFHGYLRTCGGFVYGCYSVPVNLASTGAGVNPSDLVPSIVSTGWTTETVPVVACVSTITCTPSTVLVPTYQITVFPAAPLAVVCWDGSCTFTPV
jgi:hypothetical protein